VITAKHIFDRLVELEQAMLEAIRPSDNSASFARVDGLRQEFRFSLCGQDQRTAVSSAMVAFHWEGSGFYAFAGPAAGLKLQAKYVSVANYELLVRKRFAKAAEVYSKIFMGKRNEAQPNIWVYPVLADLANVLGLHFGEKYAFR
jgi:hypothetical protein